MRLFAFISLLSAFLIFWAKPFNQVNKSSKIPLPGFISSKQVSFKRSFKSPQYAHIAWALMTGEKKGISPYAQKNFKDLELGFLFSPSGLHLTAFLFLIYFLLKRIRNKNYKKWIRLFLLLLAYALPFLAIKRLIIFRVLMMLTRLCKKTIPVEYLFFATFALSFLLGHFHASPLGFTMSFLFMGTFISLSQKPRIMMLLGLFSSHLILCFFSGSELSPLSLLINIPIVAIFTALMPMFYLYLLSFKIYDFNWIEIFVRFFVLLTKVSAKLIQGTFLSSTLFIIIAVWIILLKKQKRYLVVLLLHANLVHSPALISKGHIL